jgi:hypothetical protein
MLRLTGAAASRVGQACNRLKGWPTAFVGEEIKERERE